MSFFDSKEEVINIELTSYGKLLLSKGMLKPAYYSFHDDDVLYDTAYAGVTNAASTTEVRIQEQTPYSKPLYSFSSIKASLEKEIDQENFIKSISNLDTYKVSYFNNSLGNSSISNLYTPAWRLSNLSTQFVNISGTFGDKNIKIPQFECILTSSFYKINNSTVISQELQNIINEKSFNIVNIDDQTFAFNDTQELVLRIEELNTDVENDKFDIEIFKVDYNNDGEESYKLLKFYKNLNFIDENNFLINSFADNVVFDEEENYTDKWLNIATDTLIDTTIVCKHILKSTANQDSIFKDINICDNITTRFTTNNLYETINTATGKNC